LYDPVTAPYPEEEGSYYTILKGRFRAVETNTFGLFMIYLNEKEQKVENAVAIASHYSTIFDFDPHLPWYEFEENIKNKKWKGEFTSALSYELQSYLENSLELDRGYELYHLVKNLEQMKIESLLQAILIKPLADKNIMIETDSEFITRETMNATRDARDSRRLGGAGGKQGLLRPIGPSGPSDALNTGYVPSFAAGQTDVVKDVIDVDLVLAPVSGTPLSDLQEGDIIMVRINDKTTKGNYYIDLLGSRVNGDVVPFPAEVVEISRDTDGAYVIFCELDEEVLGKAIEPESVKVKRYDEFLSSSQMLESARTPFTPNKNRYFVLFVSITGGLLFALLLLFIIFWFTNFF
jgi:hypothetical protein